MRKVNLSQSNTINTQAVDTTQPEACLGCLGCLLGGTLLVVSAVHAA